MSQLANSAMSPSDVDECVLSFINIINGKCGAFKGNVWRFFFFFSIFLIHLAFNNVNSAENNVSPVALNYSV